MHLRKMKIILRKLRFEIKINPVVLSKNYRHAAQKKTSPNILIAKFLVAKAEFETILF